MENVKRFVETTAFPQIRKVCPGYREGGRAEQGGMAACALAIVDGDRDATLSALAFRADEPAVV